MGCWNGTDALTQLAIGSGDPVRLVILLPNKYSDGELGGGYCYSVGLYEPFGLPIKGKYDDYGCIDDIEEDANTQFIVRWFEEQHQAGKLAFSKHAEDLDKYDMVKIPKEKKVEFDIKQILNWIERGYLGIKEVKDSVEHKLWSLDHHRKNPDSKMFTLTPEQVEEYTKLEEELKNGKHMKTRRFGFMLILEDTFQAALNSISGQEESFSSRDKDGKFELKKSTWAIHTREECKKFFDTLTEIAELNRKAAEAKTADEKEAAASRIELRLMMAEAKGNHFFGSMLVNEFMHKDATGYAVEGIAKDEAKIAKWVDLIYEYKLFYDFMELSRKGFAPQAGAGSQSDCYQHHQALAKAVLDICHKREIERAKSDGEMEGWHRATEWAKKEAAEKKKKTKKTSKKKGKKNKA